MPCHAFVMASAAAALGLEVAVLTGNRMIGRKKAWYHGVPPPPGPTIKLKCTNPPLQLLATFERLVDGGSHILHGWAEIVNSG